MEPFKLSLPNGGILSGRYTFPPRDSKSVQTRPLIVCIPGGSYDSQYFDVQGAQSVFNLSSCLKIPVIAIDRPGYGASTPAPDVENAPTYAQAQGKYLNSVVFPALWQAFADRAEASAIVLLSHSIGAMMATIAAGSYTGLENYPLVGLITSGIGSEIEEGPRQGVLRLLDEPAEFVSFEVTPKDAMMLQLPHMNLTPVEMRQFSEQLNQPVPKGEILDINTTWLGYWKDYSTNVKVPLFYGLGEFDGLWTCSADAFAVYKAAFPNSPNVTCEMIPMAPHCMELGFQSQAWYMKCFAFAIECIVAKSLRSTG
ncbi:Alpha/Beta hydrolase protein [Penicillium cataractarum]|uniref:Alpha/Beta hydrolase protein n=1 Tax=Penicillium cataractarum TaxID=2100454 RepID=A0A9W9RGW1_9EURO|nr:Alpha/Beta hydrolase protein [Penicillium cataractarum]KAJ5359039.1 Alpha/Beta hydrolase protein [Penicillium cataractarum]